MAEELDDLLALDGAVIRPEVEVPPGHAGDDAQELPVEVVLRPRWFSPRRPGTHAKAGIRT